MEKEKLLMELRIKDKKEFGDLINPNFTKETNCKINDKILYNNHLNNKK